MHFRNKNALLLMLSGLLAQHSHAIDVNAGDYTALPSGTNVGVFYYQHGEMDEKATIKMVIKPVPNQIDVEVHALFITPIS